MLSCRLSSPIAVRAFGFKTPAKTKFSGYELLVGMNSPRNIAPCALCLLHSCLLQFKSATEFKQALLGML